GDNRAVKYSAKPSREITSAPLASGDNFLRDAMTSTLAANDVDFDFFVQLNTDSTRTPIEDPSIEWKEQDSPFHKVATIHIPRQQFATTERDVLAETLSFTPWHSLPEHRPLGGINRARKVVYEAISLYRHHANQIGRLEPDSIVASEFPGS